MKVESVKGGGIIENNSDRFVRFGEFSLLFIHEIVYFKNRNYFRFYKTNFSPRKRIKLCIWGLLYLFIDNARYDVLDIRV